MLIAVGHLLAVMPFITPWLFYAGAAATSIPIIIHLLNKRRFRVVVWAAMDFLLAAQRRNARRLRFQRWLLLALRCLALLILGAAIAQFFLSHAALGGSLGVGERLIVVVWDDSYSMGYANPGRPSNFDKSKKLLADWLGRLGQGDAVAIVRGSRGGEPLVAKPTLDRAQVKRIVQDTQVSDAGTDLAGGLNKALGILEDERRAQSRVVVVLTDLSTSSIGSPEKAGQAGGEGAQQLKQAAEKIKRVAGLRVIDCGEPDQANKGIAAMRLTRPVVVVGSPTELEVTVRNGSPTQQVDIPLTVLVDGVVAENRKFGKVDPGGEVSQRVNVTVNTPGRHLIEARINADLVPVDDVRRLMVNVAPEVPLLLVDGAPGDATHLGSTTFLQVAYAPTIEGKVASIFSPKTISEVELPRTKLDKYGAVILSDIARLDKTTVGALKKYVEDGGLLMVFPGDRTTAEALNATLGEGDAKLLPATVGQMEKIATAAEVAKGIQFDPMGYAHPALELFRNAQEGGSQVGLTTAQTTQYFQLHVPADGSSETILRFSSREAGAAPTTERSAHDGDPAVVSRRVGKGRVVLFASSADTSWTSFPAKPSFVPFMWELMYYNLTPETAGLTLPLGSKLTLPADAALAGDWKGPRGGVVRVMTQVGKDNKARLESSDPLSAAGVYGPTGAPPVVAVNPDGDEADIRHVTPAQLAGALGIPATDVLQASAIPEMREAAAAAAGNPAGPMGELFRRILFPAAMAVLCLEALLAWLFSMYR